MKNLQKIFSKIFQNIFWKILQNIFKKSKFDKSNIKNELSMKKYEKWYVTCWVFINFNFSGFAGFFTGSGRMKFWICKILYKKWAPNHQNIKINV